MTHVIKHITRRDLKPFIGERVVVRTYDGDVFHGELSDVTSGNAMQGDWIEVALPTGPAAMRAIDVKRVVVHEQVTA